MRGAIFFSGRNDLSKDKKDNYTGDWERIVAWGKQHIWTRGQDRGRDERGKAEVDGVMVIAEEVDDDDAASRMHNSCIFFIRFQGRR